MSIKTILYSIVALYAAVGVCLNFGAKYPDKMPFELMLPTFGLLAALSIYQDVKRHAKRRVEEQEAEAPPSKEK